LPHPSSQPVDLIIDALLGSNQSILDLGENDKHLVCDLMKWSNENKAPVLSLDMASGVNGATGHPVSPSHYIFAKWTLALGLPKTGHLRSRELTGELFLADIGIPRIVVHRAVSRSGAGAGARRKKKEESEEDDEMGARAFGNLPDQPKIPLSSSFSYLHDAVVMTTLWSPSLSVSPKNGGTNYVDTQALFLICLK
ncbi:YjeF N-terminal domain-containing protein, partial [Blyttiomyces helicus]